MAHQEHCAPHCVEPLLNRAREAAEEWSDQSCADRSDAIGRIRRAVVSSRATLVDAIREDAVKTRAEALMSDVLPTLEILHYLENRLPSILEPHPRPTPFIYRKTRSRVQYEPRGVVLVIAPWNNPFQLSLAPAVSALGAGNAVILKPSEATPHVAEAISALVEKAKLPPNLCQVAQGEAALARQLIEDGPDMVFFTGSPENGRKVLRQTSQQLIPTTVELGGKDPMIVFADAAMGRAVQATLYGAFAHAGQHCVSTRRLYLEQSIYKDFLDRLTDATRKLTNTGQWGEIKNESLSQRSRTLVEDALRRGARLILPDAPGRAAAEPTILADVSPSMRVIQEETFAPVLAVQSFSTPEEAISLANNCPFGLNSSVWSRDTDLCEKVAGKLECGNVFANNVLTNIGNPHLPFGGVKQSGLGRYHGPEGVRSFCTTKSVMISKSTQTREPNWFPHDEPRTDFADRLIQLRHGDIPLTKRVAEWLKLGWEMFRNG